MPLSRHRKSKVRKKPKGLYASAPTRNPSSQSRNVRTVAILIVAAVAIGIVAWVMLRRGGQAGPETVTASGLKYVDLTVGDGPSPQKGQTLSVHYTGTLMNGEKFDSSLDRGAPMEFQFGETPMIKGWDEGLTTMRVGGKRKLTIPPALAYGPRGKPPDIPPNATLQFEIELLAIK